MASQETSQAPPSVKFEDSPAESFLSAPGDMYPSLFDSSANLDPIESLMTPPPSSSTPAPVPSTSNPSTPAPEPISSEKKPVKKRKSWGQVLPEPKTNLPPRKRAKTEDEKEQRRVERVLRNRRAAQSSRERKRQEVEALELKCKELEAALLNKDKAINMMMEHMKKLQRASAGSTRGSSPFDGLDPSPLTLSLSLFGPSDPAACVPETTSGAMDDFILMPDAPDANDTVNPASLSPELNPVADTPEDDDETSATPAPPAASATATSSDMTQHPAAVLCDLQCQSVEVPQSWMASRQGLPPALSLFLQLQAMLTACSVILSACHHPMVLIAGALKYNLALQPIPSILSTIIWIVTLPHNFRSSTSSSSSAPTTAEQRQARPWKATWSPKNPNLPLASSTLRLKSLRKLLTSSPILARPLMDATVELLRLVSEGCDDRVGGQTVGSPGIKGDHSRQPLTWPDGSSLPSREVLLALLWAIQVEERKLSSSSRKSTHRLSLKTVPRPGSSILSGRIPTRRNIV